MIVVYTGTRAPTPVEGHHIVHLPMLEVTPLPLPADIDAQLRQVQHVLFFSRASVESVLRQVAAETLRHMKIWAVGQRTAELLEERTGASVHYGDDENRQSLAADLLAVPANENIVSFELAGSEHSFARRFPNVQSIPAYATTAVAWERLDDRLVELAPDWVVFSSPRGFQAFRDNLAQPVGRYRIAAIGTTTAAAVESGGVAVDHVAEIPNVDKLIATLLQL